MSYNGARPKVKSNKGINNDANLKSLTVESHRSGEEDLMRFQRYMSIRLYAVLDRVGASEEYRKLRQDCAISREIIATIFNSLTQSTGSVFIFGSSSEGTTTSGLNSDTDVLLCVDIPVIHNISKSGDGLSLLMISDTHTQPGYVKLQCVFNGQPQTFYTRDIIPDNDIEFDKEGRMCLKHRSMLGKDKRIDARNGPADTVTEDNIDMVHGYRCQSIPEFAREWIGRDRQYIWPSKCMLDKMSTMGCFVVGVGHPSSEENNIEWRLSFSLQERALMFSMNIVQHKCYILLKMVKHDLIEPNVEKLISSYHIKTCILYVIENTNRRFWKPENLTHCVMVCLYVLFKWVYIGYCPNFFIKEENMFDRDIHRTQRVTLLKHMSCLLRNGYGILFHIKLDQVGVFLKNIANSVHTDLNLTHVRFEEKLYVIYSVMVFKSTLYNQANAHHNARKFTSVIMKYLSETKYFVDHNEQQSEEAISYMIPCIHLHLSQSYASLAFNTNTTVAKCELLQEAGYHLRRGRHCDLTSALLLKATVVFKLEQYERCISILDQLDIVLNKKPVSVCKCNGELTTNLSEHRKHLSSLPVSEILANTSTCMSFLRSDMSITPEALHYEMFRSINTPPGSGDEIKEKWFDMAVVDAVVYLHLMQYLAHAKLDRRVQKHVAIHKLESILKSGSYIEHRETGYNLLGWIHFHENWIPQGITYFLKSWSIRPHHNAAKLHLLKWIRDRNCQR